MCEIMSISMCIIWLIVGRVESSILFAAVGFAVAGFAVAGGLYRIGRGIENAFGKQKEGDTDDTRTT